MSSALCLRLDDSVPRCRQGADGSKLAWQVVDSLVFHFLRFRSVDPASVKDDEAMNGIPEAAIADSRPVLFHQGLLAFAQRYRNDSRHSPRTGSRLEILTRMGHSHRRPARSLAGSAHHTWPSPDSPRSSQGASCRPRTRRYGRATRCDIRRRRHYDDDGR